jgi:hypothetical protein
MISDLFSIFFCPSSRQIIDHDEACMFLERGASAAAKYRYIGSENNTNDSSRKEDNLAKNIFGRIQTKLRFFFCPSSPYFIHCLLETLSNQLFLNSSSRIFLRLLSGMFNSVFHSLVSTALIFKFFSTLF